MILAFFLSLLAFASQGLAGGGQLNKQIYCTPSKSPYQYNIGLAFAAPYKGIYGQCSEPLPEIAANFNRRIANSRRQHICNSKRGDL